MTHAAFKTVANDHAEHDQIIRDCQKRVVDKLLEFPENALTKQKISATADSRLRCVATQGQHSVAMDLGTSMGGEASAPSPGFFAKAGESVVSGCGERPS